MLDVGAACYPDGGHVFRLFYFLITDCSVRAYNNLHYNASRLFFAQVPNKYLTSNIHKGVKEMTTHEAALPSPIRIKARPRTATMRRAKPRKMLNQSDQELMIARYIQEAQERNPSVDWTKFLDNRRNNRITKALNIASTYEG